jgi:type II secretion system protein G
MKKGFTLIELLIVIVIMGIVTALITTNLVGARNRAYDAKAKGDLASLKNALHSYYIDFRVYPAFDMGIYLPGCGPTGTSRCPSAGAYSFSAGTKTYMDKLPTSFNYYRCNGGDDFRLKKTLSNASDSDIAESQRNCPCDSCGDKTCAQLNYGANEIIMCGSQ